MAKMLPEGVSFEDGIFTVTMTLQLRDAKTAEEALEHAMLWRDAVGIYGFDSHGPDSLRERADLVRRVTFDWHLHHPWGC